MLHFYLYSITAVSLTVFYFGITGGIEALASHQLVRFVTLEYPRDFIKPLTNGFGFAAIALPIWLVHWRALRMMSASFNEGDDQFHQFYLFSVLCILAMFALVSGGGAVASLFRVLLEGQATPAEVRADAFGGLAGLSVTLFLWLHHWMQFRGRFGNLAGLVKTVNVGETGA